MRPSELWPRSMRRGLMDYFEESQRGDTEEILEVKADLDQLWLEMRGGKDTLDGFREALVSWEIFCLGALDVFMEAEE